MSSNNAETRACHRQTNLYAKRAQDFSRTITAAAGPFRLGPMKSLAALPKVEVDRHRRASRHDCVIGASVENGDVRTCGKTFLCGTTDRLHPFMTAVSNDRCMIETCTDIMVPPEKRSQTLRGPNRTRDILASDRKSVV